MAETHTLTIVLGAGAFAESLSNWKPVLELPLAKGYKVVAAPNPLRGVSSDAAYVSSILNTIDGPIVLVGHSYGGAVITNAANTNQKVKALVYVAAFAPDDGESVAEEGVAAMHSCRPDPSVPGPDPCCVNFGKDLAWTGIWRGNRFENHRFRGVELVHAPSFIEGGNRPLPRCRRTALVD